MKLFGNKGRLMPHPGLFEAVACDVCDSEMAVERNVLGPTSYAEALGKGTHQHDVFTCPHLSQVWHERMVGLMGEAERTGSGELRYTLVQVALTILKTKDH